ncbi:MAG: signal peptide peptidase SppA [Pirellulaceae bacterium]|nr:signal peptide peptidase SppA [Pirellulaceae bacterium]
MATEDTQPVSRPTRDTAPQIIIQQGNSSFRRCFTWIGWVGFALCALLVMSQYSLLSDYFDSSGGMYETYHSGAEFGSDKVAIISLTGVIFEGDGFVKRQIDRVRDDENVKAVVLRIDTPGGTVTASDYIYHHLSRLRKERSLPMVVSMGSMAASGGYYAAMAVADQPKCIYAEPTTTTGSIGVIIPHYDISGLMDRFDVKDDSIASHPRKQMLSMTRPIPDEHRQILQGYVDESFGRFKEIVKSGRPAFLKNPDLLEELATGEIFSATQAKTHGLVDEIGFIEDAIDRALEMAGLEKEKTRVVRFQKQAGLFELPAIAMSRHQQPSELNALLELSAPRAYYLATSLPPFVASYSQLLESK